MRSAYTDLYWDVDRWRAATDDETAEWLAGYLHLRTDNDNVRETEHGLEVREQFQDPGGFHKWGSNDIETDDACERCGVVAPDFGVGVISDHGPLPIMCPGVARYGSSHHFVGDEDEIACAFCGTTIGPDTDPTTVDWACVRD